MQSRISGSVMHALIDQHRAEIALLCRRFGVRQLEVFGSAARGADFNPDTSDADFLVTFTKEANRDFAGFADFKDALEALLSRPVDLVERGAVEASRNYIRRRRILAEAQSVYG
jgi:predicted nucleotidyltransferase